MSDYKCVRCGVWASMHPVKRRKHDPWPCSTPISHQEAIREDAAFRAARDNYRATLHTQGGTDGE